MIFFRLLLLGFLKGKKKKRQKETKEATKLNSEFSTAMNTCPLETTV